MTSGIYDFKKRRGLFIKGHKNLHLKNTEKCLIENCSKLVSAKGYCGRHYQKYKKRNRFEILHELPNTLRKGNYLNCEHCNKKFYRYPCEIKNEEHKFCSKQCVWKARKGKLREVPPIEESNWRINRHGYLETTRRRQIIKQHRWIAETQILKRPLKEGEVVHHLNGIKTDNRKENLMICTEYIHRFVIKKMQTRIKELEEIIKTFRVT